MRQKADNGEPSARLLQLAALVGAHLAGTSITSVPLDLKFIHFSIRHGMGSLLLAAAADFLAPDLSATLEQHRRAMKRRRALEMLVLQMLDACFSDAGVEWLILKGAPQSELLYGDSSLRPSTDIDILVRPCQFRMALTALLRCGWTLPHAKRASAAPARLGTSLLRDVALFAPGDLSFCAELHQRPLFLEPFHLTGSELFASAERRPFPAPVFCPALAYYIFAHGAASGWHGLKWLVDFAQVLAKLDGADSAAVIGRAEQQGTVASLAASVAFTAELFEYVRATSLAIWSRGLRKKAAVQRRCGFYWSELTHDDFAPPNRMGCRIATFCRLFALHQSFLQRSHLLAVAPATMIVRKLVGYSYH